MNQQYTQVSAIAKTLANVLQSRQLKIVLAESCTAGMASAMLATVPGVSSVLCGSSVTYREQTKTDWLKISPELLATQTAESREVSIAMARRVLGVTPEAKIAAAITGHLGPGVAEALDGRVFVAVTLRGKPGNVFAAEFRLSSVGRSERQIEAAAILLGQAHLFLTHSDR